MEVSQKTNGLFDITVAPIVNAWGFGFKKKEKVTDTLIDRLIKYVGYKKIRLVGQKLIKENPETMLDFNAIAQGYTVDVLSAFLEKNGVYNYLIEVGGELKAKGKKQNDSAWTIGIELPNELPDQTMLKATFKIHNESLATSGNYKKFYFEDGKKYTHILNPFTGYPAKNNLLSATVVAGDCMTADAYATSFMVMGLEKAKQFLADHKELGLEVFFIYDENGTLRTYSTEKMEKNLQQVQ
jgi:thiamine biosynthesis lipoprotein